MSRLIIRIVLLFVLANISGIKAQDIPGYNMSNYAGVSGIDIQPASIADMRYMVDITLIGAGVDVNNNYISVYSKYIRDQSIFQNYEGNFNTHFLSENTSLMDKQVGINVFAQLPSFAISINRNISLAFTSRFRTLFSIDNLTPQLAHLMYSGLSAKDALNQKYFNTSLVNNGFNISQMAWWEYGIDYAQVLYSKGHHFLKVGIRGKFDAGVEAIYINATKLNYNWKNNDTLSLYNSNFQQGHTQNVLDYQSGNFNISQGIRNVSGTALAADIGLVYEWRPDYYEWGYRMSKSYKRERRDVNKYKLRLGVSVLDLGFINFQKGDNAYDFVANKTNWNVHALNFGPNKIHGFDTIVINTFGKSDNINSFNFYLPTTFSIQADYNLYNNFYVNLTTYTVPHWQNIASEAYTLSYYTITPRWDHKWFGLFLPIGLNGYGQFNSGITVRLGPLIVGTSNGLGLLFSNNTYGINAYAALKIPILFNDPRKSKKDVCPTNGF